MNVTDDELTAILDALTDDGDTYEVDARLTLVLHIEYDPDTSINDYDCYGRTERYSHRYYNGEQRTPRPDDMDGSARKIEVDRGDWMWWQPSDDMKSAKAWGGPPDEYPAALRAHIDLATDLLRGGFKMVGLELRERVTDSWGHTHTVTVDQQWLGGIDSLDNGYIRTIISDLLVELVSQDETS